MNFIIPLGVALSTFGCALSIQFSVTRLCYVAGREGHMVEAFSYIHMRRLTPAPAVVSQVSDICISTSQHVVSNSRTCRFNSANTKACHWTWSWVNFIHIPFSQPVSIWSILMLYYYLILKKFPALYRNQKFMIKKDSNLHTPTMRSSKFM